MIISKQVKKYTTVIAIGLLGISLILVIILGERHLKKREKEIYEGCKSVIVTPINEVV